MVTFPANGRSADGYLALPSSGTGSGLIVIQEGRGLVDLIKSLADRFAGAGSVALAPDMYHGERATSPDQAGKLPIALNIAASAKDLRGSATLLRAYAAVSPKESGRPGASRRDRCRRGPLRHPSEGDDRSHAPEGSGPGAFRQEGREHPPLAGVHALAAAARKVGGSLGVQEYAAAHAFFNDARLHVYDGESAKLAWERSTRSFGAS